MRELKQALLAEYGHFADKRIKKLDSGDRFYVDDRRSSDEDARGILFLWFCSIFVTVRSADEVLLRLTNLPQGPPLTSWEKQHGVKGDSFTVTRDTLDRLPSLAKAMLAIVAPGVRYRTASYKYVCPRTAKSLDRLHKTLSAHWR